MNKCPPVRRLVLILLLPLLAGACGESPRDNTRPRLLLVSFDGFRHDFTGGIHTPHFDSLARAGVRAEGLIPVFPTKTFPSHYSMVTGLYPEQTGVVGNTMYDSRFGEWYRPSDRDAVENGKWYGGEPIWNTVMKQGGRAGTMFWVGSEADIQGMRPDRWKSYDETMDYRARIDTVVKWLAPPEGGGVDLATLYFEHVDMAAHRHGMPSDSLTAAIRSADRLLGYLADRLEETGLSGSVNLMIVSDHGMMPQSAERIIELDSIIDMDRVERIIWDPVTLIQPVEGAGDELYSRLKKESGHYRVYRKDELPARYRFGNHRRVFELVLVADPGYTVMDRSYRQRFLQSLPAATHGYDNTLREMQGIFLAAGPAFRADTLVAPLRSIHLYELMNAVIGTRPAPNAGSIDSVRFMLGPGM